MSKSIEGLALAVEAVKNKNAPASMAAERPETRLPNIVLSNLRVVAAGATSAN